MVNRASLSQARSRERREQLLQAAVELYADGGSRAVTHRAVAQQAGLAPASTTYYFASIEDLLREALESELTRWIDFTASLADLEIDLVAAFAEVESGVAFIEQTWDKRPIEQAGRELAIIVKASRDENLRPLALEAIRTLESVGTTLLSRSGVPDPELLAADLTDVLLGMAVRRQATDVTQRDLATQMTRVLRALGAAHLAGEATVSEQLRR